MSRNQRHIYGINHALCLKINKHLQTEVFDGFYVEGPHALQFGAILQDKTETYRLYYSFDGVGMMYAHALLVR